MSLLWRYIQVIRNLCINFLLLFWYIQCTIHQSIEYFIWWMFFGSTSHPARMIVHYFLFMSIFKEFSKLYELKWYHCLIKFSKKKPWLMRDAKNNVSFHLLNSYNRAEKYTFFYVWRILWVHPSISGYIINCNNKSKLHVDFLYYEQILFEILMFFAQG